MTSALIDAGPLAALFDRDNRYHTPVKVFMKRYKGELATTWAVITETAQALNFNPKVQSDFITWIDRGGLRLINLDERHLPHLIELLHMNQEKAMSISAATLIIISEFTGIRSIITLESGRYVYRRRAPVRFDNLLAPYLPGDKAAP